MFAQQNVFFLVLHVLKTFVDMFILNVVKLQKHLDNAMRTVEVSTLIFFIFNIQQLLRKHVYNLVILDLNLSN